MDITTEKRLLKPGDRLYKVHYNSVSEIVTIERTTKTQALSKDGRRKFRIELSSWGSASEMGNSNKWSSATYCIETDELKEKVFKQNAISKIKDFDYSSITADQFRRILEIFKEEISKL
jgi:dephospho-CoA kinase